RSAQEDLGRHLEPAVEAEAVELVGADPAADGVGRFEDQERDADLAQSAGARQPGQLGADDQDVRGGHGVPRRTKDPPAVSPRAGLFYPPPLARPITARWRR